MKPSETQKQVPQMPPDNEAGLAAPPGAIDQETRTSAEGRTVIQHDRVCTCAIVASFPIPPERIHRLPPPPNFIPMAQYSPSGPDDWWAPTHKSRVQTRKGAERLNAGLMNARALVFALKEPAPDA